MSQTELELARRFAELTAHLPNVTAELGLTVQLLSTGVCTAASREWARVEII